MGSGVPPAGRADGAALPEAARRPAQALIWALLAAVLVAVMLAGAWSLLSGTAPEPPPVLGELPGFTLTASTGGPVGLDDLAGSPWVTDFIFTRCTGICPVLSGRMLELQRRLAAEKPSGGLPAVRLVSISVDPQHDTPEVLAAYAERNGADRSRWLFLTGDWEEIRTLVGEGFKLGVSRGDPGEVAPGELVTHSDRMVLVDGRGRIRGYYHGTEEDSVERLMADLRRLGS